MSEKLIIQEDSNIAIYGAGTVADILYFRLSLLGYNNRVKYFVVTNTGGNETSKFGIRVVELTNIFQQLYDFTILIATMPKDQKHICGYLESFGLTNYLEINSDELVNSFFYDLQKKPIEKYKIIGQNQKTAGYGDNPKYIFEELHKRDCNNVLDLVWAVNAYDTTIPLYVRQVEYGSFNYYKELSTAHIWLDNSRKSSVVRKREGQYYIQTWHGAAPIKKVEADAVDSLSDNYIDLAKHDSEMADLFISGSEFYTELYRRSFWYNGIILKSGLPRHDVFWDLGRIKKFIHEKYSIEENIKIALYAPTFRTKYITGCYNVKLNVIAKALERKFKSKFVFMVSRHPNNCIEYSFEESDHFIVVDRCQDFEQILAATDVLLTDYSGCMYDFSYARKPIFLLQVDYEDYLADRDFYISMEELPYVCARSNEELVQKIVEFDESEYLKKLDIFMATMGNYDNGTASSRVVDYILQKFLGEF